MLFSDESMRTSTPRSSFRRPDNHYPTLTSSSLSRKRRCNANGVYFAYCKFFLTNSKCFATKKARVQRKKRANINATTPYVPPCLQGSTRGTDPGNFSDSVHRREYDAEVDERALVLASGRPIPDASSAPATAQDLDAAILLHREGDLTAAAAVYTKLLMVSARITQGTGCTLDVERVRTPERVKMYTVRSIHGANSHGACQTLGELYPHTYYVFVFVRLQHTR